MIKCLRARRGNVHRKQNCFRGVLLFKTHFAEFCVKSVCKTEPWNWAVRCQCEQKRGPTYFNGSLHTTKRACYVKSRQGLFEQQKGSKKINRASVLSLYSYELQSSGYVNSYGGTRTTTGAYPL